MAELCAKSATGSVPSADSDDERKKRHGRRPRSKGDDSPNKRVGDALMDDAQPRRPPAGKDG